ncbi:MAG: hypothetical protein DDT32_02298 [Syntrophomonadaceae bacterium]|nr:hypothetical protein [Bacillota bacterium]
MLLRGAQQQPRPWLAALAGDPVGRQRRVRVMRAEIEPVKVRPARLFQKTLHLGINGVNLLLGGQSARNHRLVADHDQLKASLF